MEIRYRAHYPEIVELYRDLDRNIERIREAYREEGVRPACGEGCAACCSQLVVCTRTEALAAAEALRGKGFEESLSRWYAQVKPLLAERPQTEEEWEDFAQAYRRLEAPCPFLREARCSIYPVRPVACRMLYVQGDASPCADPEGEIDQLGWFEEAATPAMDILLEESDAGIFPLLVANALLSDEG